VIMKNKKVFLLLMKEEKDKIIDIAKWILNSKYFEFEFIFSISESIVSIIINSNKYNELFTYQSFRDNKKHAIKIIIFSKLFEEIKKRKLFSFDEKLQPVELFKVKNIECIYCLLRSISLKKILTVNEDIKKDYACICRTKNIYDDKFNPSDFKIHDKYCNGEILSSLIIKDDFPIDCLLSKSLQEFQEKVNTYFYYMICPSTDKRKKYFSYQSCKKIEKRINKIIESNVEFLKYYNDKNSCSLCSDHFNKNQNIDYHCNLVKNYLLTIDNYSDDSESNEYESDGDDSDSCYVSYENILDINKKEITIEKEIDDDILEDISYGNYNANYHYHKKVFLDVSSDDIKNIVEKSKNISLAKYSSEYCCNYYTSFDEKKNSILDILFDRSNGKSLYFFLKEKFKNKKEKISFECLRKCYCSLTKNELLEIHKDSHVILKMIERNMTVSEDDYNYLLHSTSSINLENVPIPNKQKLEFLIEVINDLISSKKSYLELKNILLSSNPNIIKLKILGKNLKITNENGIIEKFLKNSKNIFNCEYILEYIDYSIDEAEAITKIFMKEIKKYNIFSIANSPLTKFIIGKELARTTPSEIILENTYCAFYARNTFKKKELIPSFKSLLNIINDKKEKEDLQKFLYQYTPEYFLLQNDIAKINDVVFVEEFMTEKNLLLLCKKEEKFILSLLKKINLNLNDNEINFLKENGVSKKILKYFFYCKHNLL